MNSFKAIFFSFLFVSFSFGQTGPGGVGTSINNSLWLKADFGVNTTTDGASISTWNDQSGNGINVSQSNANQKPIFKSNLMNGYPAIEFDNNNTSGQNDYLIGPNNSKLDSTAGYSIFTVSRLKGLTGDAQSIISKRTSIDVNQAFMLFYYTGNYMYLDIDGLGDRFNSSPVSYTSSTNYIFDAVYDGTLGAANRSKIYEGEKLRKTSTESSSFVGRKSSPLLLGATHTSDNRPFNGYISEVIIYRTTLNDAQRMIVNNYLSSKYAIPLIENDKYEGDLASKGGYYREVAGVGKESTGANTQFNPSANGGLGISINAGLDNGDYVLSGYSSTSNYQVFNDVGGVCGMAPARWSRIWYWDVTNSSTLINANITFNTMDAGVGAVQLGVANNYVLLFRANQSGNWAIKANASYVSGQNVVFENIEISSDGYYTIGTMNIPASPLPIELLSFSAALNIDKVNLTWTTASESNNDYFSLEKTKDGINFERIAIVKGKGNSSIQNDYEEIDVEPFVGVSYYRLSQTDFDGNITFLPIVSIDNKSTESISIFPNPADLNASLNINLIGFENQKVKLIIQDIEGKECYSELIEIFEMNQKQSIACDQKLVSGTYFVRVLSVNKVEQQKLIIR